MTKNIFPLGNGAGVFDGEKLCVCIVDENGNKKVGGEKVKPVNKFFSFPFLRGIVFFFFGVVLYFKTFVLARGIDFKGKKKRYKIAKNLTITSDFIALVSILLISFLFGLLGLNYLPKLIFSKMFSGELNYYLKSFIVALIKAGEIFVLFLILKFLPIFNGIYSFNGAGCLSLS